MDAETGLGILIAEPRTNCMANQAWHIMNFKGFHQLGIMAFDGSGTQVMRPGDGFGGTSFGPGLKNFSLARAEVSGQSLVLSV